MTERRRNNLDITAEILKITLKGAKKTHIIYMANLNFKLLITYLEDLKRMGLVDMPTGGGLVKTIEKGDLFQILPEIRNGESAFYGIIDHKIYVSIQRQIKGSISRVAITEIQLGVVSIWVSTVIY